MCIVQLFPDSIVWHGYRHFVSPASGIGHPTIQCYYLRACPLTIEWWMCMYMWKCCNLLWFPGRQKVHTGANTLPFGQTKCRWSVHKLILFWTTFSYLKEFKVISKNLLGCLVTKGYIFFELNCIKLEVSGKKTYDVFAQAIDICPTLGTVLLWVYDIFSVGCHYSRHCIKWMFTQLTSTTHDLAID